MHASACLCLPLPALCFSQDDDEDDDEDDDDDDDSDARPRKRYALRSRDRATIERFSPRHAARTRFGTAALPSLLRPSLLLCLCVLYCVSYCVYSTSAICMNPIYPHSSPQASPG